MVLWYPAKQQPSSGQHLPHESQSLLRGMADILRTERFCFRHPYQHVSLHRGVHQISIRPAIPRFATHTRDAPTHRQRPSSSYPLRVELRSMAASHRRDQQIPLGSRFGPVHPRENGRCSIIRFVRLPMEGLAVQDERIAEARDRHR